ncbi:uncharacterized protein [Hyperolius riggenbachi]|uniref:uncharacterized protein n=1 Tax=Hyperolius riggenbachi TaxID=752182 RepID=UPI0035A2B6A5
MWKACASVLVIFGAVQFVEEVGGQPICTSTINLPRNTKVEQDKGQTLMLRCPVVFCSGELPNVTWCKMDGQSDLCNLKDHRISSWWEQHEEHKVVHVLRLHSARTNDTGYYQCFASFKDGQVVKGTAIEVNIVPAIQPSVSLELNSAGSPECRATGGFPAAEISWIPHSDRINTTTFHNLDQTWTVISIYENNVTAVICQVTHLKLKSAWIWPIAIRSFIVIEKERKRSPFGSLAILIAFVVLVSGMFLYMRIKTRANYTNTVCGIAGSDDSGTHDGTRKRRKVKKMLEETARMTMVEVVTLCLNVLLK